MFKGYDLNKLERKCVKEVAQISRKLGTEGIVLLKNDDVLPFDKTKTVSVFGRTQIDYIKCGLGSGGLVNAPYIINIIDGLKGKININEELATLYKKFVEENPYKKNVDWSRVLQTQEEMHISDELCEKAAGKSDYALIVIGRTSGEDRDNENRRGSYLLTEEEETLIKTVSAHFEKVCVALNCGSIIDMKWVEKYKIPCVLYCWQGGMEGGNALADIILGDSTPSGKLTDTIAFDIVDYPSANNHGNPKKNIYAEDIYVGYRYFETFAKDKVLYPFGYGLSYTNFNYSYTVRVIDGIISISVLVINTGCYSGKSVVQVYFSAPQGNLGKPAKELIGYAKTDTLKMGESQSLVIEFPITQMASYDDIQSFSYVLEQGEYKIYAGENVRDAQEIYRVSLDYAVIKRLRQAMAPTEAFKRIKPKYDGSKTIIEYDEVPLRKYDISSRIKKHAAEKKTPTKDRGIRLKDVKDGSRSLDDFIMQLSYQDLTYLTKGEGMNSPRVTAGTGCAFGGVAEELLSFGIPPVCATDGPSGIRMDTGAEASLIPNGTCLASSWNDSLVEEIYEYIGIELRANDIDVLLAPGINIHRSPLNGRNFEYFSEDPFLSGKIAAACTKGLSNAGVAGTLKHFACNSQEYERKSVNSVVSERALREIYLRPFEIAVKTGNAKAIMTSYNKINGLHSATNYDLCTSILRDEWGYNGIVMTDWWTNLDSEDSNNRTNLKSMIEAQNDIYMVVPSSKQYPDNLIESLENDTLDITYLRKSAKNILTFILTMPALYKEHKQIKNASRDNYKVEKTIKNIDKKTVYNINGTDAIEFEYKTTGSELTQHLVTVFNNGEFLNCIPIKGSGNKVDRAFIPLAEYVGSLSFDFSDSFEFINLNILRSSDTFEFKNREPNKKLIYKTINGINLPMHIFMPDEEIDEDTSCVLFIHGGGWNSAIRDNSLWNGGALKSQAGYFAQKGYIAITISYRSLKAYEDVSLYDLLEDCKDALKYIRKNLKYINYKKIIVVGESAGGHLATMLGIMQEDELRPYAVISVNPVLDCTKKWNYGVLSGQDKYAISPIHQKPKKCSKFLFLHGTNDDITDITDTVNFCKTLKELGHDAYLIKAKGAAHAFILFDYKSSDEYATYYTEMIFNYINENW